MTSTVPFLGLFGGLFLFAGAFSPAGAQQGSPAAAGIQLQTGVAPDTVTVGEPFETLIRIVVPPGTELELFPLPSGDSLQQVDSVQVAEQADGGVLVTYRAVAWIAGVPLQAVVPVRIGTAAGVNDHQVRLRLPVVRSVLPADTGEWTPRPARGVLSEPVAARFPWLLLLLALLLAALLAALAIWWARRRRGGEAAGTPREVAIAELAIAEDHLRAGDLETLYWRVSGTLRRYLAAVGTELGTDLTTSELLHRLGGGRAPEPLRALDRLLAEADRVKFGRFRVTPADAARFLAESRSLIESYPEEPVVAARTREAA